jgi:hypothetical protein
VHQLHVADDGRAEPVLRALYQIVIVGYEISEAVLDLSAEPANPLTTSCAVLRQLT